MLTPFTAVTAPPAPNARLMQAIFEDSSGSDAAPDWDEAVPKPGASGTAAKGRGNAPPPLPGPRLVGWSIVCYRCVLLFWSLLASHVDMCCLIDVPVYDHHSLIYACSTRVPRRCLQ